MTTNDEQYVPSEALLRTAWSDYCQSMDACNAWVRPDGIDTRAEFDRFLARVRRDAAANALYEVATNIDNYDDYVMVHNRAKRIEETP